MNHIIHILITGAGAPGIDGTIFSLKNNPDNKQFKIITTDINPNAVGQYMSDKFYVLPKPEDTSYINEIIKIITKEKIDVILPQTTREINILSKFKDQIQNQNCTTIVSKHEAIKIANDKYLLLELCKKHAIPHPNYILINSQKEFHLALEKLNFPQKNIIIKPRHSNGQRGVRIITNETLSYSQLINEKPFNLSMSFNEINKIFSEKKTFDDYLVTDYLEGNEYTVDSYRNDTIIKSIPRKRTKIRSGISFETSIENNKNLINYSNQLATILDLTYCFGFQFKCDENKIPKILECNPRVQGSMAATVIAGFNLIYYSVLDALKINYKPNTSINMKSQFIRTWSGIGINNHNEAKKI